MIKQLYSIIQLDEAIKTMEAGADSTNADGRRACSSRAAVPC